MLYYIYSGDELLGFIYKDVTYYYHKNIFGHIIGILDLNYNEIVTYTYDSFGVVKSIVDNSNLNLGVINPFRYRSYYYDEETKLYYLNSRYYNPLWGRFISSDNYVTTDTNFIGFNMFSYANNNFVNFKDLIGTISFANLKQSFNDFAKRIKKLAEESKKNEEQAKKEIKEVQEKAPNVCPINNIEFEKTLQRNADQIRKEMRWLPTIFKLNKFKEQVKDGAKYDLKLTPEWSGKTIYYDEEWMEAQDLGNYHYGYIGRAAGINTSMLIAGAGYNQFTKYKENTFANCFGPALCDDPRDTYFILKGAQAYDKEH